MNGMNVWFEIPVTDLDRARKFYEAIFEFEMFGTEVANSSMAFFPSEEGDEGASGALIKSIDNKPSLDGIRIHLSCGEDLSDVLSRIEPAGGKVVHPKTMITEEYGYEARFIDTEGNKIGLWSRK